MTKLLNYTQRAGQYIGQIDDEQQQTKKTPTGIHLLDANERIIDVLTNHSDKIYWDTKITEDQQDNLLTFDFTTLGTIDFTNVRFITAQDQDGNHRLFVLNDIEKDHDENGLIQIVHADGDHVLLGKAEPIRPTKLVGATLQTAGAYVLANTNYQLGRVDFLGTQDVEFKEYLSPLAAAQQLRDQFKCVIVFRVEIVGNTIVRYMDLLAPTDAFDGKELEFGKDIIGLKRKENRADIVTRMIGEAFDADGNLVTFADINDGKDYVEDLDAFQRWNLNGQHLYGIHQYQPEDGGDIDKQKMLDATKEALKRTNDAAVSWEVTGAALEQILGYEHERVRVGMTIRIKDTYFEPALYLEAEVLRTEMPEYGDPNGEFKYEFGNYNEVKVSIPDAVRDIQSKLFRKEVRWTVAKDLADAAQQTATNAQNAANAAQQAADAAQADADTANALLADLSNDSKLTPSEKQATKKEWDTIVAEKPTIDAQADTYAITTAKINYDTAYNNLSSYITPLLADLTTTSTIDGPTFRAKFKDYYDKRQDLLKAISDAAKQAADTAQQAAETAQQSADNAQQTAQAAQASADAATQIAQNAQISADGKNTVFHQSTQPSTEGRKIGDLWFDTANGNRMYVWTGGAWTLTQLDYQALSVGQLSAISADLGDVTAGNLEGVTFKTSGPNGHIDIQKDYMRSYFTNPDGSTNYSNLTSGFVFLQKISSGGTYDSSSQLEHEKLWFHFRSGNGMTFDFDGIRWAKEDGDSIYGLSFDEVAKKIKIMAPNGVYIDPWVNLSLQNGWVNYGNGFANAQYMKDPFGFVHLRGVIKSGTIGYVPCGILPNGFRPSSHEMFGATQQTTSDVPRIHVTTDGEVQVVAGDVDFTSLSGICFYAG